MSDQEKNLRSDTLPSLRKLSRRQTLQWMGAMSAGAALPMSFVAASEMVAPPAPAPDSGGAPDSEVAMATGRVLEGEFAPWPDLTLKPVTGPGYGTDPNLIMPAPAPWPRLLTDSQLALVAVLADIIVPEEPATPSNMNGVRSASQVGVPEVIDEWISAPYPQQQEDRSLLEPGLRWIDDESDRRFGSTFGRLTELQQLGIIDGIAFADRPALPGLEMPKLFFARLRSLVVGAFFTSPEGIRDLGYLGNTPIQGDYPGPTAEAMVHLEQLLQRLGLSLDETGLG